MGSGSNVSLILQVTNIVLVVIIVPMVKYIFSREVKKLEYADEENKLKITALEKDVNTRINEVKTDSSKCTCEILKQLNEFKDDVSKVYVKKEDYIQTTSEIMKRLDKIYDMLYDLRGNVKGG